MSNRFYVPAVIYSVEYGNVSYWGNPSLVMHTSRGTYKTSSDVSFVYGVSRLDTYNGKKVELTLTPAGRVTNIRVLKDKVDGGLLDSVSLYGEFC